MNKVVQSTISGLSARRAGVTMKALMLGASALSLTASPALAQSNGQSAQAEDRTSFNIPAQPLASAVTAFGLQSGFQVSVDQGTLANLNSPGVNGSLTPVEALSRLLSGTGVTWRLTQPKSVTLYKAPQTADGAMVLGPVRVEGASSAGSGTSESAWGPVEGYVATRSATATKTDVPLLEIPQTVDVVTADQIFVQNSKTVRQALRYTGGIDTEVNGIDEADQIVVIRGWSQANSLTYLNGLQLGTIDPYFLERIEVLKGPASVSYGNANPGGIINTVQKLPTAEPVREVFVQVGDPERIDGGFDLGGALTGDKSLQFRLTGIGFSRRNQMSQAPASKRWAIAPSIAFRPNDNTDLVVWGSYQKDPTKVSNPNLGPILSVKPGVNGPISRSTYIGNPDQNYFRTSSARVGYTFSQRISDDIKFVSTAGYLHNKAEILGAWGGGNDALIDERFASASIFWQNMKDDKFQADNRLNADFSTGSLQHAVLVGTDYRWTRQYDTAGFGWDLSYLFDVYNPRFDELLPMPDMSFSNKSVSRQTGIYAQDQIKWQNWSLLLGIRHDWYKSKTDYLDWPEGSPAGLKQTSTTYRAGVTYLFDNGVAPYFSFSTSFEPNDGVDFFRNPYKPTTGQQYEAGIKYEIPGARSLLQASVFQITQQNLLTRDNREGVPCCFSVQEAEVRSRGAEASIKAEVAKNWSILAGDPQKPVAFGRLW